MRVFQLLWTIERKPRCLLGTVGVKIRLSYFIRGCNSIIIVFFNARQSQYCQMAVICFSLCVREKK